jgi:hypothetical protein
MDTDLLVLLLLGRGGGPAPVRAIRRLRARFNLGMFAAGFAVTVLMVRATEGGTEQVIAVTGILATFYFAWYYKAVERAETAGEITRALAPEISNYRYARTRPRPVEKPPRVVVERPVQRHGLMRFERPPLVPEPESQRGLTRFERAGREPGAGSD